MKKLVKILAGLVFVVILALVAIPFFISADYLKAQLTQQVKTATGRELLIKGNTRLKLFPNIAISAEEVTLGNPDGFKTPFFVSLKKLETGAALKPLLAKELRITGITLIGAQLNLEENANGAKNWEFATAKKEAKPAEKSPEAKSGESPLKALAIGDIVLKDSAVTILKPGAKPVLAEEINLTLSGADGSKALKLDGAARYQNQPVKAHVLVDKMKALMAGQSSPVVVELSLPTGAVSFKGDVSQQGGLTVAGVLDVAVSDLPALTAWATNKPAATGGPKKIVLKSKLSTKGTQAIALNDLGLSLDTLALTGNLAFDLAGAVPAVKGALNIAQLDLDALSHAQGAKAAGGSEANVEAPASTGWSDAKVDLSGLRAANANLDLAIGKLTSGKVELQDIKTNIALNGGALKLNLGNAALYGGKASGVVMANAGGAVGTNLTLAGIQIEPLMTALSDASRLKGTTNLTLAVNAVGGSQRAWVNSLGGNASLKVEDGALKGLNIASFLRDAKKGFVLGDGRTEATDFTDLTATFQIAQGVVSNQDLAMRSPVLRLTGKGTISMPPKTINYRLEPTLVGTLKGQGDTKEGRSGLSVPLVITGPWSAPSVTPDLAGIVTDALKDPAAFKQNLKDIKGQLKNFNSPKDIGKALLGGGLAEPAPAAATGDAPAAPAAAPTKKDAIKEGIGGLLNTLGK